MVFTPKTLDVMASLSTQEQIYLYWKITELKQAFADADPSSLDAFRIWDQDFWVYEVFLEDSTRTKESFKNAIDFHGIKGNVLDVTHSSFNKKESYADTFNMLAGYNNQIFVVRSKLEWVCTWLQQSSSEYAKRHQLTPPLFINAGDGKHEHPTQELLDQFTFLEQQGGDTGSIHIALIWDLLHGRTVHSKVSGLSIYDQVTVDLIAPELLAMPERYIHKMEEKWYTIRIFDSLDTYLDQSSLADIWYFTRVQIERMWDDILRQETRIRQAITCTKTHIQKLGELDTDEKIIFYHPLPRHKEKPVIPNFVDATRFNGRERQARNGFFVRIILLWALAGVPAIVDDFVWSDEDLSVEEDQFVNEVLLSDDYKPNRYSEWVNPLANWITVDHISRWEDVAQIKKHLQKVVSILWLFGKWGEWISSSSDDSYKWIIFRPDTDLDTKQIRKLAALAPGCTLNRIKDSTVIQKLRLHMPPKLYGFDQMSCKNKWCISHTQHNEHIPAEFTRNSQDLFVCTYCGSTHQYGDVWDV